LVKAVKDSFGLVEAASQLAVWSHEKAKTAGIFLVRQQRCNFTCSI